VALVPGARLGPYEILSLVGAGGMGEVYRARDTKLNRDIALKVLLEREAADPQRRARFAREAQSVAALNHPNIVTIYSVEEADGIPFLTMEFVQGRPLREIIPKDGMPLERLLKIAIPLADALTAAHARGITHRDLKPANIMVGADNRVKILDFGLAKLHEPAPAPLGATSFPTAEHATGEGRIVGTAAYMSPEQAEGKPLDHRTDIFSFGVILYEMATGERPFQGDTTISVISSIVKDTPRSVTEVNPALPRDIGRIIRRALVKDPEHRYQTVRDLGNDLEDVKRDVDSGEVLASGVSREVLPVRRKPRAWLGVGALIVGALSLAAGWRVLTRDRTPSPAIVGGGRLTLLLSSEGEARSPALSTDGKMIAYIAGEADNVNLYVRRVSGGERIRLTDDSDLKDDPSFSPDGDHIAFSRRRRDAPRPEICVIPALGGRAIPVIADGRAPVWSPDGTHLAFILVRRGEPEALAVAGADGADVRVLLSADAVYPFFYRPAWSPDGALVAISRSAGGVSQEVWLVPAAGGVPRRMWQDPPGVFSGDPVFTPDGRGIVHTSSRGGATNLWLMPLGGREPVRLTSGTGPDESPSVSRTGAIAFLNSRTRATLTLYGLETGETRTLATHHSVLWAPSFSPDGREVAFARNETDGSWHIWTLSADGGTPRQITSSRLPEIYPRYTPDGSAILFQTWSSEPRRIWRVARDGGQAVALTPARSEHDEYGDMSPDGRWFAFARTEQGKARIYVAPAVGGEARRLTDSSSTTPRWSPDGQWIAFGSDRSFAGGIWLIRADGTEQHRLTQTGGWPVWWPDGKQIGYQTVTAEGNAQISVVRLDGGPPRTLNTLRFYGTNYPFDVSPDASRLVLTNSQHLSDEIWLLETAQGQKK
jgi:Tol biopolymer transport system component/serine/threonine protein kinase